MTRANESPRAIAEAMVAPLNPTSVEITGSRNSFTVHIGSHVLSFDSSRPQTFEKLATLIEDRISFDRATAMIVASGEKDVPLWLVAAPKMLCKWLIWSQATTAFADSLTLADERGGAPVVGDFFRRARLERGQGLARIRVRAGQAIAEHIELSRDPRTVAMLGDRTIVRVARNNLPDAVIVAATGPEGRRGEISLSQIVGHPFFDEHDPKIADIRNDGPDLVIQLENDWVLMAPLPEAARACAPANADPLYRWRATYSEVVDLYSLAGRGARALQECK